MSRFYTNPLLIAVPRFYTIQPLIAASRFYEEVPPFHWQAYLAMHPSARAIFRSDVIGFPCEVSPVTEPNAAKLPGLTLRVDFVCLRADGSAVRLHPSRGAEAQSS